MDRRVRLEARSVTRDAAGGEVETWALVADLWAGIYPVRGQERYAAGAEQAERDARIRIRWRPGVGASQRIVYEGRHWDIRAVIEVGRREGLDLICSAAQI